MCRRRCSPGEQRSGDGAGERLSLAGEHLDDASVVEGQRAHELDEVGFFAGDAPGGLARERQGTANGFFVGASADEELTGAGDVLVEHAVGAVPDFGSEQVDLLGLVAEPGDADAPVLGAHEHAPEGHVDARRHLGLDAPGAERFEEGVVAGEGLAHGSDGQVAKWSNRQMAKWPKEGRTGGVREVVIEWVFLSRCLRLSS
jgi:hypothetical protein